MTIPINQFVEQYGMLAGALAGHSKLTRDIESLLSTWGIREGWGKHYTDHRRQDGGKEGRKSLLPG